MHTAESVLKLINACAAILSKIKRIFGDEPLITATFRIALIKSTSIIISALAFNFFAVVELKLIALTAVIKVVNVLTALAILTELFTWDGGYA